ncbi:flagellar assembly peptidoglycan hydrolase FlgJ [Denitrificimonas sp. JX-1]|uniref:Peptidoglycan hydrolase FlgJ n=1 Tax=Denitrificimonas halotolerans TaxID=3098930 RepID=A0ABU5GSC0_9GAMM|nr:flagellar assembly peptidoglycan hydrolase FlgJ [Denitrificimonas sp. JX-1]MDY7219694.1 flagellar assembly peptidoglycan hydrolase FlgJ [Denitrificimonas sp. JX-1]
MTVKPLDAQFALDMQGLERLKQSARYNPEEGLEQTARQFEALFVQMMLKSMRDTVPDSGLTDSNHRQFYTTLLDQQLAQTVASRGVGLAEQLVSQLKGQLPAGAPLEPEHGLIAGIPRGQPRLLNADLAVVPSNTFDSAFRVPVNTPVQQLTQTAPVATVNPRTQIEQNSAQAPSHVTAFVERLQGAAQRASDVTGVPSELILAQAALETGWGRYEITTADGRNSHNLFGIKAGNHWQGQTTDIVTHEYINGQRVAMTDRFRVYDSFEASFTDYARLISQNPRYAGVVNAATPQQAAQALQTGGYATDPSYGDKLVGVMQTIGKVAKPAQFAVAQQRNFLSQTR